MLDSLNIHMSSPDQSCFDLLTLTHLRRLPQGSYGAVYRAQYRRDPSLPPVAIKIIPADVSALSRLSGGAAVP